MTYLMSKHLAVGERHVPCGASGGSRSSSAEVYHRWRRWTSENHRDMVGEYSEILVGSIRWVPVYNLTETQNPFQ